MGATGCFGSKDRESKIHPRELLVREQWRPVQLKQASQRVVGVSPNRPAVGAANDAKILVQQPP